MAILKIFSVLDTKADAFMPIFCLSTTGQAVRAFADHVNDPQSQVSRHPGDYRLAQLGTFDDARGTVEPLALIEFLGYGTDHVEREAAIKSLGGSR
ncbi:MAG: nonstructural protein [Microvirus sp.]|nr:MAG: nonstructural protein [Microvirus sp.]